MVTLAIGAVVLIAALAVLGRLSTVDPKLLVLRLTQVGGGLMITAGLGLSVTGRFMIGAPLIFMGLSMLGWLPGTASSGAPGTEPPGPIPAEGSAIPPAAGLVVSAAVLGN